MSEIQNKPKPKPEPTFQTYNTKLNTSLINKNNSEFLIKNCNENTNIDTNNRDELNNVFNQVSPYNYPKLIICDDVKLNYQNKHIYKNYSDVIYDECGNRFNMRNLTNSAGLLQEGYSRNIDLDSHLKNINFYADKCFYNNWKKSPNDDNLDKCNGIKYNSKLLSPEYSSLGYSKDNQDTGVCNSSSNCNTVPTNSNCDNDVKKRYDYTKHKLQKESCIKPGDWTSFKHAPTPNIDNSSMFPNEKRNLEVLNSINRDVRHEYYQFFDNTKCVIYPQQRLFNNITKRSMLPTHHNLHEIGPKYLA